MCWLKKVFFMFLLPLYGWWMALRLSNILADDVAYFFLLMKFEFLKNNQKKKNVLKIHSASIILYFSHVCQYYKGILGILHFPPLKFF